MLTNINETNASHMASTGYIAPEFFIYFDRQGLIQNVNNLPLLYHKKKEL